MSIVLGVLAALCGGCGLAALYFGYDLGGTERGVAYTVSGTIAASAGAVMIGLTVLSVRLKQLLRLLGKEPVLSRAAAVEPVPAPLSGSSLPPARDQRPGLPGAIQPGEIGIAAVAAAATALVSKEGGQGEPEQEERAQHDTVAAPPPPEPGAALFEPRPLPEINLGLDDLLEPDVPKAASAETAFEGHQAQKAGHQDQTGQESEAPEPPAAIADKPDAEPDAEPARLTRGRDRLGSIFGPPAAPPAAAETEQTPATPGPEGEPQADDTAPEAVIEDFSIEDLAIEELPPWHGGAQFTPEPPAPAEAEQVGKHEASADDEPAATPEQPGRKVIGSYTVGPNSYTMYGDGSVEALTPNGLYSFGSLEELRSFIEKGGSPAASGR